MSSHTTLQKEFSGICDICLSNGTSVCKNCLRCVCIKCIKEINADLCSATKGKHDFEELEKIPQQQTSADVEALSSQRGPNVNEGMADEGKEWSCSRCTYLNPPEYKICTMCASSRGFSSVGQTEFGSYRVCRNCTFYNKQGTTVCEVCHKTLDLTGPQESFV